MKDAVYSLCLFSNPEQSSFAQVDAMNKEDNTIIRTDDFEEVGVWNEVTGEVDFHSGDEE